MEEKRLEAVLNAFGTAMQGEVIVRKQAGEDTTTVKTDMHPTLALLVILQAAAIEIHKMAHVDDDLEIDISGDNLHGFVHSLADWIIGAVKDLEG